MDRTMRRTSFFRKAAALLLLSVCVSLTLPLGVLANGPVGPPSRRFYINVKNLPQNAAGLDLMLPADEIGETSRSEMNTDTLTQAGLSDSCELALYDDGFVSYLAHFRGAAYTQDERDGYAHEGYAEICEMTRLKIAVYDEAGSILALSEPFGLKKNAKWNFSGTVDYDVRTGVAEPDFISSFWVIGLIILGPVTCVIAMVLTIVVEVLAGLLFRMRPLKTIAITTGISNLIMNVWLLLLHYILELPWLLVVAVLELLVLFAEYGFYKKRFTQHTSGRIMLYTLVANAASFVIVESFMVNIWRI